VLGRCGPGAWNPLQVAAVLLCLLSSYERFERRTPYPYVGSKEDMGEHQRRLYLTVWRLHTTGAEKWEPGQKDAWLLLAGGQIVRAKSKSRKATTQEFCDDLANGTAVAALRAENVSGDLFIYDVEELGKARVSVRGKQQDFKKGTPNYIIDASAWTSGKGA